AVEPLANARAATHAGARATERQERYALLPRAELPVAVQDGMVVADPQLVDVKVGIRVVQRLEGIVRDVEAEAKLVDGVLVDRMQPEGRQVDHVRSSKNGKVRVDKAVVVSRAVHREAAEETVPIADVMVEAAEVLVGIDELADALARSKIERVGLAELGAGQEGIDDLQSAGMNLGPRNDVIREGVAGEWIVDQDGRPKQLARGRVHGAARQLGEISGAKAVGGKKRRLHGFEPLAARLPVE